ncbi:hypothetical protein POL68_29795 [Stigmatella sp. ncwal1]|uniref:TonB C-terminal domain-containing protein n=1 Tax=Stigmatella ashevillensis TaxID=2995309 RepID=A0ABT5DG95_9BACT|nr:hypothetical protein [Stigmatella ashevillena]MDC0712692.1 hypothetical protein [Stigmatella ashevillena]
MRRSRLGRAALASLLIHGVLLALLWGNERASVRPLSSLLATVPVEVDLVFAPPALPAPTALPAAPPTPSRRPRPKPFVPTPAAPPAEAAASKPPEALPSKAPAADAPVAEKPLLLSPPSLSLGGTVPIPPEPPRGRTLRPGDPSLSPEVLAAEEHARVSARVQTFAENELATLRVENGLVDSYFGRIDTALEKQMENAPLFGSPKTLQRMARSYQDQAARYGAGQATSAPLHDRAAPTASERLESLSKGNPADNRMRAFVQSGEALQRLAEPQPQLVVILELQQAADGQLRSVLIVEPSGNKAFDTYVVEAVPPALAGLAPPAGKALGIREEGIRSRWAVEGSIVYLRHLKDMKDRNAAYLAAMAALGVLSGRFEETTGDLQVVDLRYPSFVCRSRLLQVW